jgi:hypothetical protein
MTVNDRKVGSVPCCQKDGRNLTVLMLLKKTEVRRGLDGPPPVAACRPSEAISKQDM